MVGTLQPLAQQYPIVDGNGRPTEYFIRWAQERQIDIGEGISATEAQALIDAFSASRDIIAGTALSGGGNLSSDVTLNYDGGIVDQNDVDVITTPPTDGQVLVWSAVDSKWIPADQSGGGGGGALTKLAQHTISVGGEASWTYSGIPQTFDDLIVVAVGRSENATAQFLIAQANGDTSSTNYRYQRVSGASTTASAAQNLVSGLIVGILSASDASVGNVSRSESVFSNYADTAFFKGSLSSTHYKDGTADTGYAVMLAGTEWRNTAAITSLTFADNSGSDIAEGTTITVYGRGGTSTPFGTPFETTAIGTGASQNITLPVDGLTVYSVLVFVNGIRYPTSEYSISGTTLTLTSNASGDSIAITGFMP